MCQADLTYAGILYASKGLWSVGVIPFTRRYSKNRLPVLRAERGWSQAELAQRLGGSRQTVNAIERRTYDPSLPLAFKIAEVFGW